MTTNPPFHLLCTIIYGTSSFLRHVTRMVGHFRCPFANLDHILNNDPSNLALERHIKEKVYYKMVLR
jgi:hypothetical protein